MGQETSRGANANEILNKKIAVLKANSNLSEGEIRKIYEEFKVECPSGKMNREQFHKYYKKMADSDDKMGVLSDLAFRVFDTNHDGTIDFEEFVMAIASQSNKDLDSQLDLSFSMLDASGDGCITYDEMVKFMTIALPLAGDRGKNFTGSKVATEVFEGFGLSKDQRLTRKQFMDGCKRSSELRQLFGI